MLLLRMSFFSIIKKFHVSKMPNSYLLPLLVSSAIVIIIYLMKKDEPDANKRPNYLVLFVACSGICMAIYHVMASSEDGMSVVMREVAGGEPPF
jgi:hypothetical protein